jgi:hypothetical protein
MRWGCPKNTLSNNLIRDKYCTQTKRRKIKITPSNSQNDLEYLKELVILMMKADSCHGAVDNEAVALSGLLRKVPTLKCAIDKCNCSKAAKTDGKRSLPTSYAGTCMIGKNAPKCS